jgi:hypothetical protein
MKRKETKMIDLKNYAGVILYEGPSMIDGAPIVVIANRITTASNNSKTGAMVQTFIMRQDVPPHEAIKTGDDESICGDCTHRPANGGSCYVKVFQAPLSTWKAYKRGRYLNITAAQSSKLFAGRFFRLGTYGDPAAAPYQIWRAATLKTRGHNGYTHQWKRFASFKTLCMASADTVEEAQEAQAQGWRTFRVKKSHEAIDREVTCPASKEAGARTSCVDCRACGGTSAKARANIVINDHGPKRNRA